MRHVPLADLQAHATELTAAIDAGEDVVITMGGRDYRLVEAPVPATKDAPETVARRRRALADLEVFRSELRADGVRVTRDEIREWINEGRP